MDIRRATPYLFRVFGIVAAASLLIACQSAPVVLPAPVAPAKAQVWHISLLDPVQWREQGPQCLGIDMPEDFEQGGNFFSTKAECQSSPRFKAALEYRQLLDQQHLIEDLLSDATKTRFICRADVNAWIAELDPTGKPRYRTLQNFKGEKEQCLSAAEEAKREYVAEFFRKNPGFAKFKNKMEQGEISVGMPEEVILLRFGQPLQREPSTDKKGPVEIWHYNKDGVKVRFIFRKRILADYKLTY